MVVPSNQEENSYENYPQVIHHNFKFELSENKIKILVDESESGTFYFVAMIFFLLDTLDILISLYINLLLLGIVSVIIDFIIIGSLAYAYRNYKDLKVKWIFDESKKTIKINRFSSKINEMNFIGYSRVESIILSKSLYVSDRYLLSLYSIRGERYKLCYGTEDDCIHLASHLTDYIRVPVIRMNFYRNPLIILITIFIGSSIGLIIIYFFIEVILILNYILIIILKTVMILIGLKIISLTRNYIIAKNQYLNDLIKFRKII
ncbi:MAG: hypothetical protein GF317_08445 [Candidatus Lokiarchaeota archaeon]|nr:hypothetical protein [Candidatus Lokiarchaeota archaeon]MBD3199743.1 hypothetical protein [Candidatus Lokiarchaeota archaeon]